MKSNLTIISIVLLSSILFSQINNLLSSINNESSLIAIENIGENVNDLFVDPENKGRLIACKFNSDYKIKISTDNGEHWTEAVINTSDHSFPMVLCSKLSFEMSNYSIGYIAAGIDIYKTTDRGESWDSTGFSDLFPEYELRNYYDIHFVQSHPYNSNYLFTSNVKVPFHTTNLFQSINGGEEWTISDSSTSYDALEFDPLDTNTIYGIEQYSIIKKTYDGGRTWESINNNLVFSFYDLRTLAIHTNNPNVLYCGQLYDPDKETWRLSITTDAGETWNRIDSTLLDINPEGSVYSILLDQNVEGRFYVSFTDGLYLTEDNGKHYEKIYAGGVGKIWSDNSIPATIYFNSDQGLMRLFDTLTVSVEQKEPNFPLGFNLYQNYPNPFNPTTKISYSIPNQSVVSLKVFDVLGREIASLVSKEQTSGNYEVEFDASSLTSGIYFYRIQAGQFVESKKMILMK